MRNAFLLKVFMLDATKAATTEIVNCKSKKMLAQTIDKGAATQGFYISTNGSA